MTTMTTLAHTMKQLKRQGFADQFQVRDGELFALRVERAYQPEDLNVVQQHRFEGTSNPADEAILLAIRADDGVKGTLCTTFGPDLGQDEIRVLQALS